MNSRKCPDCKECLDLFFHPNGTRYYLCWLCGKYYKLTMEGLVEVPWNEVAIGLDRSDE